MCPDTTELINGVDGISTGRGKRYPVMEMMGLTGAFHFHLDTKNPDMLRVAYRACTEGSSVEYRLLGGTLLTDLGPLQLRFPSSIAMMSESHAHGNQLQTRRGISYRNRSIQSYKLPTIKLGRKD